MSWHSEAIKERKSCTFIYIKMKIPVWQNHCKLKECQNHEKIFATHISNKELNSLIYEYIETEERKKKSVERWAKWRSSPAGERLGLHHDMHEVTWEVQRPLLCMNPDSLPRQPIHFVLPALHQRPLRSPQWKGTRDNTQSWAGPSFLLSIPSHEPC